MGNKKGVILFLSVCTFFVGFVGGYVLGSLRSTTKVVQSTVQSTAPAVFGLGTDLIGTFKQPDGTNFDLTSTFAFTSDYFHCVVTTNEGILTMPTYSMGTVTIPKNQFFMSVDSVQIEMVKRFGLNGVELDGTARSITRVGDKFEDVLVPFKMVAKDGGPGYEKDSAVLVVNYSKETAPLQYAIFGPETHFGHGILSGDVFIAASNPK